MHSSTQLFVVWVWIMVIFRWLFLFSPTETTHIDELQLFSDRTNRSCPLNRGIHTPWTMLGIVLSRHRVYQLAFTSTKLLPMAFDKRNFKKKKLSFPCFSLSFNLVKILDYLLKFISVLFLKILFLIILIGTKSYRQMDEGMHHPLP